MQHQSTSFIPFLLLIFLLINLPVEAQQSTTHVDPIYPGGIENLHQFLDNNIAFPKEIINLKKKGVVYASFFVEQNGRVDSIWIARKFHPLCDLSVYQALEQMEDWQPMRVDGNPVRCRVNIPIGFNLNTATPLADTTIMQELATKHSNSVPMQELTIFVLIGTGVFNMNGGKTYLELGLEAMDNGDNETALKYLMKVYKGDPNNSEILLNLGILKQRLNKTKSACNFWKRALRQGNESAKQFIQDHCQE